MSRATAVVVTFNRLSLLKECLRAIEAQTHPVGKVLVINNASTDGTREYLDGWFEKNPTLREAQHLNVNTGGSGGFTTGIREAFTRGADWIWVMDDDSIPSPTALEELISAGQDSEIGFVAPLVMFKDGSLCLPNATQADPMNWAVDYVANPSRVRLLSATFVGLLIHRRSVEKVGLPVPNFFIWYDDIEYTLRITKLLKGVCAPQAKVTHMIPENVVPDFSRVKTQNSWKHQFGIRNETAVAFRTRRFGIVRALMLWRQRNIEMKRGNVPLALRLKILSWGAKGLFFPYTRWIEFPGQTRL